MSILEKILEGRNIKWIEINDAGNLYGGLKGKTKNDFNRGNAKFISYKNIFANPEVDISKLENVDVGLNENQNEVIYGDILFTGSSEIASEVGMSSTFTSLTDYKVYLNSFSFGLRLKDEYKLLPEFSKYIFRSRYFRDEVIKTASGVTRYNVSKKNFVKIKIPIPCPEHPEKSLEIQKEIVRILDELTEKNNAIISELSKEIELRKKQYEYYRDKLLNFNEMGGGNYLKMSDLGMIIRGNGLPKSDFVEIGIPAIHYGQIYTYYNTVAYSTRSFVSAKTAEKLQKVNFGDVVITNTSENLEDVGKALLYLGKEQAVTGGHASIFKPSELILGKYFVYYTQTINFYNEKKRYAKGIKVIDVSAKDMEKILVFVPSLTEQTRIVKLLDEYDLANNTIIEELARELKLRKAEYEYYRNLLLDFPMQKVSA